MIVFAAYRHSSLTLASIKTAVLILAATFIASNILVALMGSDHMYFFPMMDTATGTFFVLQWRSNLQSWALALVALFAFEDILHGAYSESSDHGFYARYAYDLSLNIVYVMQLSCVCIPAFVEMVSRRERMRNDTA